MKVARHCADEISVHFLEDRTEATRDNQAKLRLKDTATAIENRLLLVVDLVEKNFMKEDKESKQRKKSNTYTAIGSRLTFINTQIQKQNASFEDEIKQAVAALDNEMNKKGRAIVPPVAKR